MKYDTLIMVAGLGQRMQAGCNKVFLSLDNKPVFAYSLEIFLADNDCQQIILVGRADERIHYVPYLSDRVIFVNGGAERQDSVRLGLEAVTADFVMVHDGARPFVTVQHLQELKKQVNSILAVPVKDTIKKIENNHVVETIPRELLYQAQTPQLFERNLLVTVHKRAVETGFLGTDDASLVEAFSNQQVTVITGSYTNIKLTTPEDMLLAENIVKEQNK
ncbi:2-C-methyl-D-erythritol 4-phosphate cytidylyltransferase [Streptococcus sp. DD10]|uniref:2-C-methyl-D-erythritol 4-phosphate cytidylyltransferase n=1 Tax=Streptococcus sp. DD10 TaxID=1777878 RepID=UPI000799A38F|nr:2-C-methyl-D-erythritol 4-phosphate cytidylyltransferase [Streptococcus sp. DD10]KXT74854.1 2-C-methyl-D-erythritol 4-phosphate cytidylyltransferase [Streptococcus sp. DD10]